MSKAKKMMKFLKDENLILEKIEVINLFGHYNYTLDLSPKNDLTIIFGLNGTGKTTLLKCIDNFCKLRLNEITEEKFEKLIFQFSTINPDDIHSIEVIFSNNKISIENQEKLLNIKINTDNELFAQIKLDPEEFEVLFQELSIRYIKKSGVSQTDKIRISERIDSFYEGPSIDDIMEEQNVSREDLNEDMDVYTHEIIDGFVKKNDQEHLKSLFLVALSCSCFFISSMRITVNSLIGLNERIKEKTKKVYFIGFGSPDEQQQRREDLQIELNELKDLLFVDAIDEISKKIIDAKKSNTLNHEYIKIFKNQVNHFLKYSNKKIEFNSSGGILIRDSLTQQPIPIEKLSSGENNLLIIFYHILFETEENTLVMIDEPEISLHIDWQFDFIDKLLEIQRELRKTKPLMFLIATHSPQILSDHQDRAIKLE